MAMSLPKMLRPSALWRATPFRDCGGYSRWGQQLDGCRGTRAALRRVEYPRQDGGELEPLFGGSGSRPKKWMAAAYGGAVAFRGVSGAANAFQMFSRPHDGFQMLSGLSDAPTLLARCRCLASTQHRINNAHWTCQHPASGIPQCVHC